MVEVRIHGLIQLFIEVVQSPSLLLLSAFLQHHLFRRQHNNQSEVQGDEDIHWSPQPTDESQTEKQWAHNKILTFKEERRIPNKGRIRYQRSSLLMTVLMMPMMMVIQYLQYYYY